MFYQGSQVVLSCRIGEEFTLLKSDIVFQVHAEGGVNVGGRVLLDARDDMRVDVKGDGDRGMAGTALMAWAKPRRIMPWWAPMFPEVMSSNNETPASARPVARMTIPTMASRWGFLTNLSIFWMNLCEAVLDTGEGGIPQAARLNRPSI